MAKDLPNNSTKSPGHRLRKNIPAVPPDPRHLALTVLLENENPNALLDRILDSRARDFARLSQRDRSLANTIIHGTLRHRGRLDWIIAHASKRPLEKISDEILYLIRSALFQIVFLDRIPASAAVNTAVAIAKRRTNKGAAGFVNAVLRKAGSLYASLTLPDRQTAPQERLAIEYSLPRWLAESWIKRYGLDTAERLADAVNQVPRITLRTNTLKTTRDLLIPVLEPEAGSIARSTICPDGLFLSSPACPIKEMEAFRQGLFQVQDEAAQLVTLLLAPEPGNRVLDACAGRGGKTGHTAQLMKNQGIITAADVDPGKLKLLEQEMTRLGATLVTTCLMDLLNSPNEPEAPLYDRVLVDAPCTGLGVLRRNPDTKWKRRPGDVTRMAERQKQLLINAAGQVAPGGLLVYAVCSPEPEENEAVVDALLQARKGYQVHLPASFREAFSTSGLLTDRNFVRTWPTAVSMDGFFAAALKRESLCP